MRTFTSLFAKLSTMLLLSLASLHGKSQEMSASGTNAYTESKRLNTESEKFAEQAAMLRENARYVSGSGHDMLIEEAEAMEKLAMTKSAEGQKLEYNENLRQYENNALKISSLEKFKESAKNASQIRFLAEHSVKNRQIAGNLYREGNSQPALALRIASYQNANESMNEALRQQKDLIQLLKNEALARK